jgi:hypothetical protein
VGKCGRAGQATDDNMLRSMRIACWIPAATDPHSECVILLFHYKNSCTNAPHWYVIRKLSVLLCRVMVVLIRLYLEVLHGDVTSQLRLTAFEAIRSMTTGIQVCCDFTPCRLVARTVEFCLRNVLTHRRDS